MMSEERKMINYIVSCVTEFGRHYHLSMKDSFQYLYQYKGIEFLKEHYDIEHTLSYHEVLDDIQLICKKMEVFYNSFE